MPLLRAPIKFIQKLTGYESPPKARLNFSISQAKNNNFVVDINTFLETSDGPIKLEDTGKIDRYGEKITVGDESYQVKTEDFETLLSILDCSPDVREDGALTFEIFPPGLKYLRKRDNVDFSDQVKEIEIDTDKNIDPALKIDFDPKKGAKVSPGYSIGSSQAIQKSQDVDHNSEGWFRSGNIFYEKPKLSTTAIKFFDQKPFQISLDDIPEFFLRDLALLNSKLTTVLTDKAKEVEIIDSTPQPTVSISKSSKGWLDFDIEYELGDYKLTQKELSSNLDRVKESSFRRLDDDTWLNIEKDKIKEYDEYLEGIGAQETKEGYRVEISKFQSLEEFIEDIGGGKRATKAYQEFLDSLQDFSPNSNFSSDKNTEKRLIKYGINLRDYQREGSHWLHWLQQNRLHGILADEMGLGKTVQALIAIKAAYQEECVNRPTLIVSPKSVLGHWKREARKVFDPHKHNISIYHGQNRNSQVFNTQQKTIFISTYATVRNDAEDIANHPLFYLVLDEATKIKNRKAKRSRAVKALNSAHRIALSGTPIENRTSELWSIFDFLMEDHLGTHADFQRNFATPIENNRDIEEGQNALEELQNRIQPFFTRRNKSKVAKELPEKITNEYFIELTEEQKAIYGQIQDSFKNQKLEGIKANFVGSVLPILTKLKQVCIHPALIKDSNGPILGRSNKFDSVIERLEEILNEDDQAVVFTQYLKPLDLMEKTLPKYDISYIRIDGSTENRQELIDIFRGGEVNVALCSVRATEHGINLQSANHVLHMDFWWNPATERQATARVHRLGQEKTVQVHKFYVENTLEEKIKEMLKEKQELANEVFQKDISFLSKLGREELLEILRPID